MHVIIVACPHPLSCCIYTLLVLLVFDTVIPTSFNILMEMFLLSCFTDFSFYRNSLMPYYVSMKAYNSTIQDFRAVQYVRAFWACRCRPYTQGLYRIERRGNVGREGQRHFQRKLSKYGRWRAGILRKRVNQHCNAKRSYTTQSILRK